MRVQLIRQSSSAEGTFGELLLDGRHLAMTCEDPWNNNRPKPKGGGESSCIPTGTYQCRKHNGPKYKNVWEVTGVPGRSAILIHNGNTIDHTDGCILVGKTFSYIGGKRAVTNSVETLNLLRMRLPDEFVLEVSESFLRASGR